MISNSKNKPPANSDTVNIHVVQEGGRDWRFEQRESQRLHTAYEWEQMLFSCVRDGDEKRLEKMFGDAAAGELLVGKLSRNDQRQAQYLAVAFMTLATRAAIQGGMFEMDAYNKSDAFIQQIDSLNSPQEVILSIIVMLRELTCEMKEVQQRRGFSKPVRQCLEFIYQNLHSKITLNHLAELTHLTPEYLSCLFKKEVGMTLSAYILKQKVREAEYMLTQSDFSAKEIGYFLNFSSQSHFIHVFKTNTGMTPLQYQKKKLKE